MKVNMENFDKLDGYRPKSLLTLLTKRVYIKTVGEGMENVKSILNPRDKIEFATSKTNKIFRYIWTGSKFIEDRT